MKTSWMPLAAPCAALWLACGGANAQQAVVYFDRAPTVAQVQAVLLNGAPVRVSNAPKASRLKMRGIEWGSAVPQAEPPASERQVAIASVPGDAMPMETPQAKEASQPRTGAALAVPINFDSGASRVSKASVAYLEAIAEVLARNPELRLGVEGHTDAHGDARSNVLLSWDRSVAVLRFLVERHGIDPSRLQPQGLGEAEPVQPDDPYAARNRRVQFRVLG